MKTLNKYIYIFFTIFPKNFLEETQNKTKKITPIRRKCNWNLNLVGQNINWKVYQKNNISCAQMKQSNYLPHRMAQSLETGDMLNETSVTILTFIDNVKCPVFLPSTQPYCPSHAGKLVHSVSKHCLLLSIPLKRLRWKAFALLCVGPILNWGFFSLRKIRLYNAQ